MNLQTHSASSAVIRVPVAGASLSLGSASVYGSDAPVFGHDSASTSISELQLMRAIRHAAQLAPTLPASRGDVDRQHDDERCLAISPGAAIADFRIVRKLGAGAFAQVFLAFHESMQRLVAIKFSTRPSNEPKLLSSLDHPHIVRVYHYDDRSLSEQGLYILSMEYVPGVDLKRLLMDVASVPVTERNGAWLAGYLVQCAPDAALRDRWTFPDRLAGARWPEIVSWIGARIAAALACAHRHNVIHRDIKPANVLLRTDGNPMLVDFNVGFGEQVLGARPEDFFGGSLPYMAPEQRNAFHGRGDAADVDGRCDIYSLGVLVYELLTGCLPDRPERRSSSAERAAVQEIERRARDDSGPSIAAKLESCPDGLRDTVTWCLAPDASGRLDEVEIVARRLHICSSPEMHGFVFAPAGSWAATAARHPFAALLTCVLAPNVFFAVLNIAFVDQFVSDGFYREVPIHSAIGVGYFTFQKIIVNAIVFPLGIGAVIGLARPFVCGLESCCRRASRGQGLPDGTSERRIVWRYAGRLGFYAWMVVLGCWIGTGVVFPTWNGLAKLHYTGASLAPRDFATFVMTQVTFGCLASALSVLGVNCLLTRCLLPILVRDNTVSNATCLDPIANQVQRMVHWLAFLPQLSLLAVALLIAKPNPILFVMLGLVSGGCYGCGILYARCFRRAENRMRALLAPMEVLLNGAS